MKIGFACLTVGVPDTQMRTCRKKSATPEKLQEIILNNLEATENILAYNIEHGIKMYRLSSDLIPFGSDLETNNLNWVVMFADNFARMGRMIAEHGIRVSMHPGQYTVLNSPDEGVVERAIADLAYHNKIMDALNVDQSHKIILHIGGVYGDKEVAMARFVSNYARLSGSIKDRLIIENDDRLYTIEEVLAISHATGAPVVYDNLHNACNPADPSKTDAYWIRLAQATWNTADGPAKVHYSQQKANARLGAHTATIYIRSFLAYYKSVASLGVDIMLEVKDKNLSAMKCKLATTSVSNPAKLEQEWARYKYLVLMQSPTNYQAIRELLKDKETYPVIRFYELIEEALDSEPSTNMILNAIDHIWGHVKNSVTNREKDRFLTMRAQFDAAEISFNRFINWLHRLAIKYNETYLLQSLIFEIN